MKRNQLFLSFLLIANFSTCFLVNVISEETTPNNSITLTVKIRENDGSEEFFLIIQNALTRLGINLDIQKLSYYNFMLEILTTRNYDLGYMSLIGSANDPDMLDYFSELGFLNMICYEESIDYSEEYEMGENEWYLEHGLEITPINSTERITHYWNWQEYFMSEILPCQPMFIFKDYCFNWNNLEGFDFEKGIIQSWGQMYWDGTHFGQSSLDELVVIDNYRTNQSEPGDFLYKDNLVFNAMMDSLLFYDYNKKLWPHLAEDWWMINTTHIRMKIREGVKWQTDIDGNFTDEYLDTKDIYFTYYLLKNYFRIDWLKDMKIIDQYTIDFYIDRDIYSSPNDPGSHYFDDFGYKILPEYYLNQSQLADGKTPDYSHIAWERYGQKTFGTGLFEMQSITENKIVFSLYNETWYNNTNTINDKRLDWDNRFGSDYQINNLIVKHYNPELNYLDKFEAGTLDILEPSQESEIEFLESKTDYDMSTTLGDGLMMIFCNLNPEREYIGSLEPCEADTTITKGLAFRKAISYSIDRSSILTELKGIRYAIDYYPMATKQGIWCSPDITRYNYDLLKAQDYFILAMGQPSQTQSNGLAIQWIIGSLIVISILTNFIVKKMKK